VKSRTPQLILALLCLVSPVWAAKDSPWHSFTKAWNGATALREFSSTLNRLNETTQAIEKYERGLVVSAADDRKVLLDRLKADYAASLRLLPEVERELKAEQLAAEGLKEKEIGR
jgi:hypothetical protein